MNNRHLPGREQNSLASSRVTYPSPSKYGSPTFDLIHVCNGEKYMKMITHITADAPKINATLTGSLIRLLPLLCISLL